MTRIKEGQELCKNCGEAFWPGDLSAVSKRCWPCFQEYIKEFDKDE